MTAIMAYAAQSFPPGRPVLEAAIDLMERMRADFTYDPVATTVMTPARTAFDAADAACARTSPTS